MAIQRWDPLQDLLRLKRSVDQMFEDVLSRSPSRTSASESGWAPPLDLIDAGPHYVVHADLPGVQPSEVDVQIEDGNLLVRGERREASETPSNAYLRVERPRGRFVARLALPPSVDRQRIEARHRNGVLEILLHKRRDDVAGRIAVASG